MSPSYSMGFQAWVLAHPEVTVGNPTTDEYPHAGYTLQDTDTGGTLIYDPVELMIGYLESGADLVVAADSLRLRRQPSTASAIIVDMPRGTPVHQLFGATIEADGFHWAYLQVESLAAEGYAAIEYLSDGQPPADDGLSLEPDHAFSFEELWPYIQSACAEFGFDPKVLAGMVMQESNFVNLRYHRDKTGHGLLGLDDNGMLPGYEAWSGTTIGRGTSAEIMPPMLQLRYAAKILAGYVRDLGPNGWSAWYTGKGGWGDADSAYYESRVHEHILELFG